MSTLGIDFGVTKFKYEDTDVSVNIFDLAGQPFFFEVRNEFYKDTQGALLVYDASQRSSFDSLGDWLVEMRSHLPNPTAMDNIIFAVCANKTDVSHREVTESEGKIWAETKGFLYFETSALTGKNVVEMFHALFAAVVATVLKGRKPARMNFDLKYTPEQVALVTRIRCCGGSHEILSLPKDCSREDVNRSYRQLAILLHPDKNQAPGSEGAFRELARAREDLLRNIH
jgi:DnaJ family protein C protein 27